MMIYIHQIQDNYSNEINRKQEDPKRASQCVVLCCVVLCCVVLCCVVLQNQSYTFL